MRIIIAGDFSLQGRVAKCQDLDVLRYLMGGGKYLQISRLFGCQL